MQTILTSVASAAVISGDLIIGLSDGSIINCGRVQGPIGLTGDQGPMGATGRDGERGNTIHTVQGTPDTTLGKDGDFAINVKFWEIYGPRAGGAWGSATPLRGNKRGGAGDQQNNIFGNNSPGSGGGNSSGGIAQTTSTLPLSGKGTKATVNAPGGSIIEEKKGLKNQAGLNNWLQAGLTALDTAIPIEKVDPLPVEGKYEGELVYFEFGLWLWIDAAWVEVGGKGKESQPFIEFEQFKVIVRSDRFDYDPLFETNPIANHSWEYQINLDSAADPDAWVKVDDLPQSDLDAIGWYGSVSPTHLRLKFTVPEQKVTYPNAQVRFYVKSDLNGIDNEAYTCVLPAWENGECGVSTYEDAWIKERFATNSKQIQFLDTGVRDNTVAIKKGLVDQAAINAGLKTETEARKVADSDLQAQIDGLEAPEPFDPTLLQDQIEAEKAFRLEGDATIAASVVEEARIRADEDYKLLARINGLEIPEMPGDYDDSGLRELIETESALRITGDAALNAKIDLSEDKINAVDEKVEQEKAARIAGDTDLEQKIKFENEGRERGDSDLQAQIDELETSAPFDPTPLEEKIEGEKAFRLEGDLKLATDLQSEADARQRGDSDLQAQIDSIESDAGVDPDTFAADQKRQDDALTAEQTSRIQTEIKLATDLEQESDARQRGDTDLSARIDDLEGVEYLNDLKDVDLTPVRSASAAGAIESTYMWLHYANNPDPGEMGINGMNLVINKVSYSPSNDPQELIDKIKAGVTVNLKGVIEGAPQDEDVVVQSIVARRDTYEIEFTTISAYVKKLFELGHESQGVVLELSYVDVSVTPPPNPNPTPPPSVTAGTFLGFDDTKQLWVPQTLDVSGGGVTDLSNYYKKTETYSQTEVDDLLKDNNGNVNPGDYYTKSQVDASQSTQDSRLDALEAGSGGGGPADLSNYYTKAETYTNTETDQQIYKESVLRLSGDEALQVQINDLQNQSIGGELIALEAKVETNKEGILKNKGDIAAINTEQTAQDRAISDLETVVAVGLDNRYTKTEVDEIVDNIDIPVIDNSNLLAKDEDNKVTNEFRIASATNTDTYISFYEGKLGVYNLRDPEHAHHAVSKGYADDGDRATLASAKEYTDAIDLSEFYTKDEVDAANEEQDNKLDAAATLLSTQVEQNESDIAVLQATNVNNLNDLEDVRLAPPRIGGLLNNRKGRNRDDEVLQHPNKWNKWLLPGNLMVDHYWYQGTNTLHLSKTVEQPFEWDSFYAKLLEDNVLHVRVNNPFYPLISFTDRYTIAQMTEDQDTIVIEFVENLDDLNQHLSAARNHDAYELTLSLAEVNTLPPVEPEAPTKRSEIVLGYDETEKLWTPHKADYLPLSGGTLTSPLNFQNSKDYPQFSIVPKQLDDYATNIFQRNGGDLRFRTTPDKNGDTNYTTHIVLSGGSSPETRIYNVCDPNNATMAVSKGYMDGYVKRHVQVALPGALYKCVSHSVADDLTAGEFFMASGNIYMHPTCLGGQDMEMGNAATFDAIIRISNASNGGIIRSFNAEVKTHRGSNNVVRGEGKAVHCSKYNPVAGTEYIISVPGWI